MRVVDDLHVQGASTTQAAATKVTQVLQAAVGQVVDIEQVLAADGTTILRNTSIAGVETAVAQAASGKTGATATTVMLAGGTASGAPTTGTHVKGELVPDDSGAIWYCTVGGTPGTWISNTPVSPVVLADIVDPSSPAAGKLSIYPKAIAGRSLLKTKDDIGRDLALQPALFYAYVERLKPATGASLGGDSSITAGTLSTTASEVLGRYTNFVTAAAIGGNAGGGLANTFLYRGSQVGVNGFFVVVIFCLPDVSYRNVGAGENGSRFFIGLASSAMSTTVAADDESTNNLLGFSFSHTHDAASGNWQAVHSSSSAASEQWTDTGIPLTPQHRYMAIMRCAPQGTTANLRLDDLTAGTSYEGVTPTTNLPAAATPLRAGVQMATLDAVARNIGMLSLYAESLGR